MLNGCLNIVSRHKVIVLMVWLLKILKTDGHDKYKYCENNVRTSMYLMSKYLKTLDLPHHPRPARAQWCRRGDLLNVIPSHKISSPRPRTEDRGIAAVQENGLMSGPRRNLLFYAWFDFKRSLKCHRFYRRGHQSLVMFSTERVLDNIYICCVGLLIWCWPEHQQTTWLSKQANRLSSSRLHTAAVQLSTNLRKVFTIVLSAFWRFHI